MILRSALLCLALLLPALAAAQGTTAFTYQGRLYNNGALVNGSGYVLRVTAYAQENGGNPLVPAVLTPPLEVVDGVFSTTLDFGNVGTFFGQPVWLAVEVQAPASSFVPLNPRQRVTPTPYAINADTVDGFSANELQGQQGPPGPTGIVAVATFSGAITPLAQSTSFAFVGGTANITVTSTQRLTAAATASFATASGTANVDYTLCWRQGAGQIFLFPGATNYVSISVGTLKTAHAATASTVPGVNGVLTVGACARVNTAGQTLNTSDFTNGWVFVSN